MLTQKLFFNLFTMQTKTLTTCIFNTFIIKTTIQNHNFCIFKLLLQIKHIVNFKLSIKLKKNIIQIKHINKFRQILITKIYFFIKKVYHSFITVYIILSHILAIQPNLNLDIQTKVSQTILSTTEWE